MKGLCDWLHRCEQAHANLILGIRHATHSSRELHLLFLGICFPSLNEAVRKTSYLEAHAHQIYSLFCYRVRFSLSPTVVQDRTMLLCQFINQMQSAFKSIHFCQRDTRSHIQTHMFSALCYCGLFCESVINVVSILESFFHNDFPWGRERSGKYMDLLTAPNVKASMASRTSFLFRRVVLRRRLKEEGLFSHRFDLIWPGRFILISWWNPVRRWSRCMVPLRHRTESLSRQGDSGAGLQRHHFWCEASRIHSQLWRFSPVLKTCFWVLSWECAQGKRSLSSKTTKIDKCYRHALGLLWEIHCSLAFCKIFDSEEILTE